MVCRYLSSLLLFLVRADRYHIDSDGQCCNWVDHVSFFFVSYSPDREQHDGYTLMYPNGDSDYLQGQALKLAQVRTSPLLFARFHR